MTTFVDEFSFSPPTVESVGGNWFLWSMGFILGLTIELGTNTAMQWPCLAQPSDVAESIYFTYWYIRNFLKDGYKTTNITYVAVYIARGWEAIMLGPCWELNIEEIKQNKAEKREAKEQAIMEANGINGPTQRNSTPPKNLTPQEQQLVESATQLAKQFEQEMVLVETIFTVMSLLEILVDVVTFYDLQNEDHWFDAGTFAGKGLINAGFTTYYVTKDYFAKPVTENEELTEGAVDL